MGGAGATWLAVLTAVGLVAYNLFTNLRHPGDRWYVPRNVVVGVLLVWMARAAGLTWADLGFHGWAEGLRWSRGIVIVVIIGVAIVAAAASRVPALDRLLSDRRADLGERELAWHVLVRIPVGTAAFEEVAFRGVLLGLLLVHGEVVAVVGSAVAFGLWHIGPTLAAHEINRPGGETDGRLRAVAVAVAATTVGGVIFGLLRFEAGIVTPVVAHWSINGLGLLAAAVHQRTSAGSA